MKKTLCLTLLLVSIAGSAFAVTRTQITATGVVPAANATTPLYTALYAGTDQNSCNAAVNATIRFSTNVDGNADYGTTGYSIFTKHFSGSKVFGTANDSTNVYWKASPSKVHITTTECGTTIGDTNFNNANNGWTSY